MAAQREGILLLTRDPAIRARGSRRRARCSGTRRDSCSTSAGLGATLWPPIGIRLIDSVPPASDGVGEAAHDPLGPVRDRLQARTNRSGSRSRPTRSRERRRAGSRSARRSGPARPPASRSPRITSSMSAGSIPGARRSASRMHDGAPSRRAACRAACRRAPCRPRCGRQKRLLHPACAYSLSRCDASGSRRTSARASIRVDGVADLFDLSVEQVIRRRRPPPAPSAPAARRRTPASPPAGRARRARPGRRTSAWCSRSPLRSRTSRQRGGDADQRRDARSSRAPAVERDARAEREAGRPQVGARDSCAAMKSRPARKSSSSPTALSNMPVACADAAEIEAQHRAAQTRRAPSSRDTRPSCASCRRTGDAGARRPPPRAAAPPASHGRAVRAAPRARPDGPAISRSGRLLMIGPPLAAVVPLPAASRDRRRGRRMRATASANCAGRVTDADVAGALKCRRSACGSSRRYSACGPEARRDRASGSPVIDSVGDIDRSAPTLRSPARSSSRHAIAHERRRRGIRRNAPELRGGKRRRSRAVRKCRAHFGPRPAPRRSTQEERARAATARASRSARARPECSRARAPTRAPAHASACGRSAA